ncbi:MAG: hybrid sensor histidine kinase/response regulator [Snowella sp.]|jgi:chemotaxis family two-component system sensor histidine kinase/response regulator PixL|nr:MAG: hybrid sensor histidine kinase/response regulator [Snowella sp.]
MMNPDIRDHAYQFFVEEAPELLQIIEDGLLTLRAERTSAKVHDIMRAAHSLKGGAASVELPTIKDLAHRLEDIFKAFYNEATVLDEDMESLLLQGYDCLKEPLLTQISQGSFDEEAALNRAQPVLEAIEFLLGDRLAEGDQYLPSSADLGVDIVSSIFEVDITEGLGQIASALDSGDSSQITDTLRSQTEVFSGLAELLNLTGFKAITETVQQAIQSHPDQMVEIAQLALMDWRGSCEQVLQHGDRVRGGNPSGALLALVQNQAIDNDLSFGDSFLGSADNAFDFNFADSTPAVENGSLDWSESIPAMENGSFDWSEPIPAMETGSFDWSESIPAMEMGALDWSEPQPLSVEPISASQDDEETDDNADIDDPSYQFFIEEAPELLQIIEDGLLTLRGDRSSAKVHEIMRAAHSLKGGSASVGLTTIKTLSHRLEDIIKAFYNEETVLDEDMESLLLQGFDCLKETLLQQLSEGHFDGKAALAKAKPVFELIEVILGDRLAEGDQYLPSSADLGVDIVSSIFEVDITQGLQQVAQAIATGDSEQIKATLEAQTEVFLGLAELLNLSGFKAITVATQTALQLSPDQSLLIAELALADWQKGCNQVLQNGDRQLGGSPSEQLIAFTVVEEKIPLVSEAEAPKMSTISDLFWGEDEEEEVIPEVLSVVPETEFATSINAEETKLAEPVAASLEDVFGAEMGLDSFAFPELEELPTVLETVTEIPEEAAIAPNLEDVFGGLIPDSAVIPEEILAEVTDIPAIDELALADMVQSVEQAFAELPTFETNQINAIAPTNGVTNGQVPLTVQQPIAEQPEIPTVEEKAEKATPTAKTPTPAANLSIRVDFYRLERMNNWVGELAINRNSLSLQNEQLQGSVRSLLSRFSRFQNMTGKLRELADQLVIMPERREQAAWISTAFDALEMDSYGALSGQLQDILEEMMQLEEAVDDIVLFARATDQGLESQRQMLFSLRDELMWARMLPLGEVLNRFPRMLRDLSTKYHKPVQLKLRGTAVLVDKLALEKLYDPMLHLLRNAFDHGIESPEVRRQNRKPETGTIEIHSYHQGNQTIIEIQDDGGGLKLDKITKRAIEVGLITEEQSQRMAPDQIYNLVFEPGFSTAEKVSELSGRGVGLDVVRQQIQSLKGNVSVSSRPGRGSTFTLRLPLTLTIAKLLVCLISQDSNRTSTVVAIPSDSVSELMVPRNDQIKSSGGQRFLIWQQQMIPIYQLNNLLPYNLMLTERLDSKSLNTVPQPEDWNLPLILIRRGDHYYALEVTRLLTEQELVIKPFGSAIASPDYLYGCTILGDGTLIPVINGGLLLEWYWDKGESGISSTLSSLGEDGEEIDGFADQNQPPTVLVVDDSAALRRTLALTLEKSGYRVIQAKDGQEALLTLGQTIGIQLVICDVEMPNLNGFEFLGQRRRNPDMMKIPVAMLTSRGSEKHRQLAMHLGASAYFTKPYIEQQFLMDIQKLLSPSLDKV